MKNREHFVFIGVFHDEMRFIRVRDKYVHCTIFGMREKSAHARTQNGYNIIVPTHDGSLRQTGVVTVAHKEGERERVRK